MKNIMIDIETMSTQQDAAIVSIGAVYFCTESQTLGEEFYLELDWQNQNRHICENTKRWWREQNKKHTKCLNGDVKLQTALEDLCFFVDERSKIWGNGPSFDITILENALRTFKMDPPWKFYNIRDCRTINELFETKRGGTSRSINTEAVHNALEDAKVQARQVCKMWKNLTT